MAACRGGEAVRARSAIGACAEQPPVALRARAADFSDRPLPRQGDGAEHHDVGFGTLLGLMAVAICIAFGGWGLAHHMYSIKPGMANEWAEKYAGVYRTFLNKYWVDELYDVIIVEPCKRLGQIWDWIDQNIIDRFIRGVGKGADASGAGVTWAEKHVIYAGLNVVGLANHLAAWSWRRLQTGLVNHYAAMIVIGLFVLVHFLLVWLTGTSVL